MKRISLTLFFCSILLLVLAKRLNAQNLISYDSIIHNLASDFETPGIALALMDNYEFDEYLYGYSNIESGRVVTEKTLFNVASISKIITALSVLQLLDKGKLDLDVPIKTYLKSWQPRDTSFDTNKVTTRRVLNHSAGFSREFGPGFSKTDSLISLTDILSGKSVKRQPLKLVYEPGSQHLYSNMGYGLLQLLVEEVSGVSFKEYVKKNIFAPLKMSNSTFQDPLLIDESLDLATPYNHLLEPQEQERFVVVSAAGLISNLRDLELLLLEETKEKKLLSKSNYEQLINYDDKNAYGLGHILSFNENEIAFIGHTGLGMGWNSSYQYIPDAGKGIIVLTNGDNGYYIHNTLVCYWYYTETGKRIKSCNVALNKKLNRVELLIEIAVELEQLKVDDVEKYLLQINQLRNDLEQDNINSFSQKILELKNELNTVLSEEIVPLENLPPQIIPLIPNGNFKDEINIQFESLTEWLNLTWADDK